MTAAALGYAFTLGFVAAVNPCGFPLLPAYLAVFARSDATCRDAGEPGGLGGAARGLAAGAGITVGFVTVFAVAGGLIQAGLSLTFGWLPWAMVVLGLGLSLLGLLAAGGRPVRLSLPVIRLKGTSRTLSSMALFGIAYAMGSLGCALPLFLAAVGGSFTRLGPLGGAACYLSYALGMGLFVTAAAVGTAAFGRGVPAVFRRAGRLVPRLSGVILAVTGAYLAYYWAVDLLAGPVGSAATGLVGAGTGTTLPVRVATRLQSAMAADLGSHVVLVGAVLLLVVVAGFAEVVRRLWTGAGPQTAAVGGSDRVGGADAVARSAGLSGSHGSRGVPHG